MISDKGLYGMISGVLSTAVLQPFENIKMALMIPPRNIQLSNNFILNLHIAYRYILKEDGYRGFYKGMIAATAKAGLGCYIYFSILRHFEKDQQSAAKDFFLSSLARIISTIITNPLNIIETRFELADFHQYTSVRGAIHEIYTKEGFMAFFSGGLASCLKEGFFAGFYYMIYEELKDHGFYKATAGMMSGILSTAITHPFELIRARLQIYGLTEKHSLKERMILREMRILRESGDWLKGLTPRLLKKPIANTTTFLMF